MQTTTSRARVRRGIATQTAKGVAAATAETTGGGTRARRRISGTATPTATTPQAAVRRAVGSRTGTGTVVRLPDGLDPAGPPARRRQLAPAAGGRGVGWAPRPPPGGQPSSQGGRVTPPVSA